MTLVTHMLSASRSSPAAARVTRQQRYEKRQLDGGREPARPNHEIIHDRNLQYDDDEDSAACQPEIKGLVGKLFVGVDHWRTG